MLRKLVFFPWYGGRKRHEIKTRKLSQSIPNFICQTRDERNNTTDSIGCRYGKISTHFNDFDQRKDDVQLSEYKWNFKIDDDTRY